MMCSMCPRVTIANSRGPGYGWICPCRGEVHCAHVLQCPHCQQTRYALEKSGQLRDGRPTKQAD